MEHQILDFFLLVSGEIMMICYHAWLLYRVVTNPARTVIGIHAIYKRLWVRTMMEDPSKNRNLIVKTLGFDMTISSFLATATIAVTTLMVTFLGSGASSIHYGSSSDLLGFSLKFLSIVSCFIVASLLHVQSCIYYIQAISVINIPLPSAAHGEYVQRTVKLGGLFSCLGLRCLYFSIPLLFWIFGPVPMFSSCCVMVLAMYFLDVIGVANADAGYEVAVADADAGNGAGVAADASNGAGVAADAGNGVAVAADAGNGNGTGVAEEVPVLDVEANSEIELVIGSS